MPEITTEQTNRLELLAALGYDTAATKVAVAFIQNDPFKHRLFIQKYSRVTTEYEVVAKTIKAIQEATEALALFDTGAEQES